MVTDLTDENDQENAIISEYRRAHRNSRKNKQQLLERIYFPQMRAKITKITKMSDLQRTKIRKTPK